MNASDFTKGMRVLYVPNHAQGDRNHPDCEWGTVRSANDSVVFVCYDSQYNKEYGKATRPDDLIT